MRGVGGSGKTREAAPDLEVFLRLALETFRREEISRAKLVEVTAMVDVAASDVDRATLDLGLDDDGGAEVHLPGA
jgi:hypothetical protein